MAQSLGCFAPGVSGKDAYKMLCLAWPELPERMKKAEADFLAGSVLKYFINQAPEKDPA